MILTNKSQQSGIETTKDLPITADQLKQWRSGEGLIQNIFPNLTPYQRDWLKYGYTEDEYKELYGNDEQPSSFNDAVIALQKIINDFKSKFYDDKLLQEGVDAGPIINVIMDNMNQLSNVLKRLHEIVQSLKEDDDSF